MPSAALTTLLLRNSLRARALFAAGKPPRSDSNLRVYISCQGLNNSLRSLSMKGKELA